MRIHAALPKKDLTTFKLSKLSAMNLKTAFPSARTQCI